MNRASSGTATSDSPKPNVDRTSVATKQMARTGSRSCKLAGRRARAERSARRRRRVPDVRLLVLARVHQREADEQCRREDRADEHDRVKQPIVAKVHEEQDDEGRL